MVRWINRMALDGYGYAETAAALEADSVLILLIKAPTGAALKAPWSLASGAIPPSRKSSPCRDIAVM